MINKLTKELISPFLNEIERKDMPQIAEKDIEEMVAILEDNDIGYKAGPVIISRLHPTQEDFQPDKVKEMVDNLKSNKMVLFPIVVSEDGYIMDGHHRWLAAKELYGENAEIPAIIIDLPKDEALLMFTKTSDKIDETITENPDTIYDNDGNELAAHAYGTAIAFGYNYDGDMYVGGPNVWHNSIADWYESFDSDGAARFAPAERDEMEYSGRFWVESKVISFWEYPSKETLQKVLTDIENELKRIHDEFPEFAEEDGLPLVNFDDDEWKIDIYTKEELKYAGIDTDKTDADAAADADLDTDDKAKLAKMNVSDFDKQRSLGLTKNVVNRDTSDRIAGRGRYQLGIPGSYEPDEYDDDEYSDETDSDYEDPNDIKTGTQIPIKDYTGQTEKEKMATAAQAQAIQHVVSPLEKDKKDVPTGLGSRKRKNPKMSNAEYKDFICREQKSLSDFLVDSILTETPDTVYDKDGQMITDHALGGVAFGYYEGKMYISSLNDTHPDIASIYKKIDDDRKWDLQMKWPTTRRGFKFSGRFWAKEKLISFWEYPEASEIDKIFRDIEEELPRFKKMFEKYIKTADETEAKKFERWHDAPAETVKFDDDWIIDTAEEVTDRKSLDIYGHQVSVGEYKIDSADSETPAQWSPEKMAKQHVLPPGHPDKEKRDVSPGWGSRKRKDPKMTNTEYQQYVCTSEGKTLSDFLVKNILTEDPDTVYDEKGQKQVEYDGKNEFPFGYNRSEQWIRDRFGYSYKQMNKRLDDADKMRVGELGKTHADIPNLYGHYSEYSAEDRDDFRYSGRVFLDKKIITFWEFPKPEELQKVLNDIEKETERIKSFKKGDEVADIKFDDSWTIDIPQKSDWKKGDQIPINDYTGQTEKEKARSAERAKVIQHVVSPVDKEKKEVPPGLGSRKRKHSKMSNAEYKQFTCREGISDTLNEDTDTSVIKKKINNVEFEFKYNYHAIESYFTVSRDGVIVDRMPATLSKAEMSAFMQQNYSQWQADYVKSFGSRFTQIPQQGTTQGVYGENKENLIDISVFLE